MADKYLISALVSGVTTYYTADSSGAISSIGNAADWTKGFDAVVLSKIDNTTYSTLSDCKVWINNTTASLATEDTTGEGLLWTRRETAINTNGYSGITKIAATGSAGNKYAISFYGNETFMTRGAGTLASSTAAIPITAANRTSGGVTIPNGSDAAFDGDATTKYTVASSTDSYIEVDFATAIKLRKHTVRLDTTCRKPCTVTFQAYDATSQTWKSLDTIIIKVAKLVERNFSNDYTSTKYRWHFEFDSTAFGDDPTKNLVINELSAYGEVTGTTWIGCTKDEIKTKGIDATTLAALVATDYAPIFNQAQMDVITYIPAGSSLTSLVVTLPANSAPQVTEFVPSIDTTHDKDVTVQFNVKDPEGSACTYKILVDGVTVIPDTEVDATGKCSAVIPNKYMTIANGLNNITVVATDEFGASSSNAYYITKVDSLPGYVGSLVDNEYTFNVSDADGDKVAYTVALNGKQIAVADLQAVPFTKVIELDSSMINVGVQNTLTVVLTDAVGGVTTVTETFVGDYYGLIFTDSAGKYLSNDLGKALIKLDFGTIMCGQATLPIEVFVLNKTSYSFNGLSIVSPKDIDGRDVDVLTNGVKTGTKHIDGTVFMELCNDDGFLNEATFFAISLKNLASKEKTSFYARVESKDFAGNGGSFEFDTTGSATYDK